MNIAFFLTPKEEIVYEEISSTMRQVLEKMEYHRYTAIPILDGQGKYIGTLTEGDLLWKLKNTSDLDLRSTSKIKVNEIPRRMVNKPIHINSNIEDLLYTSVSQNFIPVVDDNEIFIGIIKRSDILSYCYKSFVEAQLKALVVD